MQHTSTARQKGETVKPNATTKLVERDGVTKAAKALGVSTTTLHKARNQHVVSKVVEVAAAGILKYNVAAEDDTRSFSPPDRPVAIERVPNLNPSLDTTLYLLEVPSDKVPIVERFAEAIHAHVLRA